jgi:hypothetical protein
VQARRRPFPSSLALPPRRPCLPHRPRLALSEPSPLGCVPLSRAPAFRVRLPAPGRGPLCLHQICRRLPFPRHRRLPLCCRRRQPPPSPGPSSPFLTRHGAPLPFPVHQPYAGSPPLLQPNPGSGTL